MYLRRLNTRSELVLIDGYTDSYGGGNDNLKISNRRAKTIREHFVKNGIDPNRIETKDYAENAI
jgi:outer membrane protein OmpA-like peptidoglycan-associated protein